MLVIMFIEIINFLFLSFNYSFREICKRKERVVIGVVSLMQQLKISWLRRRKWKSKEKVNK